MVVENAKILNIEFGKVLNENFKDDSVENMDYFVENICNKCDDDNCDMVKIDENIYEVALTFNNIKKAKQLFQKRGNKVILGVLKILLKQVKNEK